MLFRSRLEQGSSKHLPSEKHGPTHHQVWSSWVPSSDIGPAQNRFKHRKTYNVQQYSHAGYFCYLQSKPSEVQPEKQEAEHENQGQKPAQLLH